MRNLRWNLSWDVSSNAEPLVALLLAVTVLSVLVKVL
jgi:hypothetical protein